MTAVTAVEPPGADGSLAFRWLWGKVYRPYLQFFYLNNAYHFYSPEPGPPVLVWFRIDYTDNKSMWYRIPNDEDKVPCCTSGNSRYRAGHQSGSSVCPTTTATSCKSVTPRVGP